LILAAGAANNSTARCYTDKNVTFTLKVPAIPPVITALFPHKDAFENTVRYSYFSIKNLATIGNND
jgi:hypothetical protein